MPHLPGPVLLPAPTILGDALPGGEVVGQQALRTATAQKKKDAVEDVSFGIFLRAAPRPGDRHIGGEPRACLVREVSGIRLSGFHALDRHPAYWATASFLNTFSTFELQIRTLFMHAYVEPQHDIGSKAARDLPREIRKEREEDILANTLAVPLQPMRTFGKNDKGWHNMLVFGDNLLVMKSLLELKKAGHLCHADGTPGVRLVYIDPPFATKQEFSGNEDQKAYQDKVVGAQFLEFLRQRLAFMSELLSEDGSIYVHVDWKKSH
jgi:hypothetical protein